MTTGMYANRNKGVTLVELIAAISIASIVAGAIGALVIFCVRMYSNQSMITLVQKEVQTSLNQIVDSAESASWFYLNNETDGSGNVVRTKAVAFGKIVKSDSDSDSKYYYVGELFVAGDEDSSGRFNVYMNRYAEGVMQLAGSDKASYAASAREKLSEAAAGIVGREEYLIGEDASKFIVKIDESCLNTTDSTFSNPISFDINVGYARQAFGGKLVEKEAEDQAMLRNSVKYNIYVGSVSYSLKE